MAKVTQTPVVKLSALDSLLTEDKAAIKKRHFISNYEIIQEFSDYASIQGLVYIFFNYQTLFGRLFWIVVVVLMLGLGVYWINEAYVDWQNRPVLTSITTTAYSVKQVDFPAVTICSPGLSEDGLMAGFLHLFFEFLLLRNISINVAPIKAAEILFQIDWTKEEIVIRDRVTTNLNSPLFQVFVNQSFPGLSKEDDLLGLVKLLTSKNPDSDIAANVALDGGYDPCNTTNLYGSRKQKQDISSNNCLDWGE